MTEYNVFSADGELLHTAEHANAELAVMSHNELCDCDLAVTAVAVKSIYDIVAKINPDEARMIVARAMVAMGSEPEWDSEMIEIVAEPMLKLTKKHGWPSFTTALEGSCEFWQSVQ